MSNGHGGARPGSGRKRKALAEKILYAGNGNHKITKLKEPKKKKELSKENCPDISGNDMPPVSEYLKKMTKNTNENIAPEIYEKTWQWLKERGCEQFVKVELIEQYALYIARWVQCEEGINSFGLLAKHPTTGSPIASPYVSMGLNFLKQANIIWGQIFQIVKENSSVAVGDHNPADDVMAKLLKGKD
jgi:hypothetical protein